MNIAPKFSEVQKRIPNKFTKYIQDYCEIQLLSVDINIALYNAIPLIEDLRKRFNTKNIILHMPFKVHIIEYIAMSKAITKELMQFLDTAIKIANKNDIDIKVLFHTSISNNNKAYEDIIGYINRLLEKINDTRVSIILENEMISLNEVDHNEEKEIVLPAFETTLKIEHRQLYACLDLCHIISSENMLGKRLTVPRSLIDRIYSIHFSSTYNGTGYKDKAKTHSKVHKDFESMQSDLQRLMEFGVDLNKTVLVTEITEDNYEDRQDMLKELELLYSLD